MALLIIYIIFKRPWGAPLSRTLPCIYNIYFLWCELFNFLDAKCCRRLGFIAVTVCYYLAYARKVSFLSQCWSVAQYNYKLHIICLADYACLKGLVHTVMRIILMSIYNVPKLSRENLVYAEHLTNELQLVGMWMCFEFWSFVFDRITWSKATKVKSQL